MYVIPKLRLNRFKSVPCPSSRRLFELFGLSPAKIESAQTAENIENVIPTGARKTQLLELGSKMAEKAADFVENPKSTKPLDQIKPRDL